MLVHQMTFSAPWARVRTWLMMDICINAQFGFATSISYCCQSTITRVTQVFFLLNSAMWELSLKVKMGRNLGHALRWRHNGHHSVSNHQPHDCLLNHLFRRTSKKTSKLRVTGLCAGNSPGTGEFPAQMASNAENVSIWWRHHGKYDNFERF